MEGIDIFLTRLFVIVLVLCIMFFFGVHPAILFVLGIVCLVALIIDAMNKDWES